MELSSIDSVNRTSLMPFIHILILWHVQSHWQSVGHPPKPSPMSAQCPHVWCIYMSELCGIILRFSTFVFPCQWPSHLNTNQYWFFSLIQLLVCLRGYSNLSLPRFPETMTLSRANPHFLFCGATDGSQGLVHAEEVLCTWATCLSSAKSPQPHSSVTDRRRQKVLLLLVCYFWKYTLECLVKNEPLVVHQFNHNAVLHQNLRRKYLQWHPLRLCVFWEPSSAPFLPFPIAV